MNQIPNGEKSIPHLLWLACGGVVAIPVLFGLAFKEILPAMWGGAAIIAVPFVCMLLFVGMMGTGSPQK